MQELYLSGVVFVNTEGFRGVLAAYDAAHTLRYGCNLLRRVLPVTDVVHWLAASRAARKERGRKEGGKLSLAGEAQPPVGGFTLVSLPPLARARSKQGVFFEKTSEIFFGKSV